MIYIVNYKRKPSIKRSGAVERLNLSKGKELNEKVVVSIISVRHIPQQIDVKRTCGNRSRRVGYRLERDTKVFEVVGVMTC